VTSGLRRSVQGNSRSRKLVFSYRSFGQIPADGTDMLSRNSGS